MKLASIALSDLGLDPATVTESAPPPDDLGFYELGLEWFEAPGPHRPLVDVFLAATAAVADFDTYFSSLAALHKRRKRYARILTAQPLPTTVQLAPRSLLEYGTITPAALSSWLVWRKWFFDIDNRAGQETGYLFEPILASALGGSTYGARSSPIRRSDDTTRGRQVDCLVDRTAYEFKLRVTIAASGQGRFGEELGFAEDCRSSGYRPVLLVLDPTPSTRLDDLTRAYADVGGEAHIGDAAWLHLEEEAGPTMATFVEKYVRHPISALDLRSDDLLDLSIERSEEGRTFTVSMSNLAERYTWPIIRAEDQSLVVNKDEQ